MIEDENFIDNLVKNDTTDYSKTNIGFDAGISIRDEDLIDTSEVFSGFEQTFTKEQTDERKIKEDRERERVLEENKRNAIDFYGYKNEEEESNYLDYVRANPFMVIKQGLKDVKLIRLAESYFHGGNWLGTTSRFIKQKMEMSGLDKVDKSFTVDKQIKLVESFDGLTPAQKSELLDYGNASSVSVRASQFMEHNSALGRLHQDIGNNLGYQSVSLLDPLMLAGGYGGWAAGAKIVSRLNKGRLISGSTQGSIEGVTYFTQENIINLVDEDKTIEEMLNTAFMVGGLAGVIGIYSRSLELRGKAVSEAGEKIEANILKSKKERVSQKIEANVLKSEEKELKKNLIKEDKKITAEKFVKEEIEEIEDYTSNLQKEVDDILYKDTPELQKINSEVKDLKIKKQEILKDINKFC